jgi:predicted phage tail protein
MLDSTPRPKLTTVRLYGKMGAKFGRVHHFHIANPAEAIRAFCAMFPGFEEYLYNAKDRGYAFGVLAGKRHLTKEQLQYPHGNDVIRFAPIILGAKQGGIFQIILGSILIVAGFLLGGPANPLGAYLIGAGISMVLGGVVQLLSPHPKGSSSKEKPANTPNYSFNGIVNTEAQGNPIPVMYGGPKKVGSAIASAGIFAIDGVNIPTAAAAAGGVGFAGALIGIMGGGGGGTLPT